MSLTKSNIPFFDRNGGPFWGCSWGCPECYARRNASRFEKDFSCSFNGQKLADFGRGEKPLTVGVGFHSDWCDKHFRLDQRVATIRAAGAASHRTFIFLTKQPRTLIETLCAYSGSVDEVPANCFFGVTARDAEELEVCGCLIRAVGASGFNFWLSLEPCRSLMNLDLHFHPNQLKGVVMGGQSGGGGVPLDPEWVRRVRDFCEGTKTKFMFKQVTQGQQWADGFELFGLTHALTRAPRLNGRIHAELAWPLHEKVLP